MRVATVLGRMFAPPLEQAVMEYGGVQACGGCIQPLWRLGRRPPHRPSLVDVEIREDGEGGEQAGRDIPGWRREGRLQSLEQAGRDHAGRRLDPNPSPRAA